MNKHIRTVLAGLAVALLVVGATGCCEIFCKPDPSSNQNGSSNRGPGTFPGEPIKIGPGGGGNLTWTEGEGGGAQPLAANDENTMRSDLANGVEALGAEIPGALPGETDTVGIVKARFKVEYESDGETYTAVVVLQKSGQSCADWSANGLPVATCAYGPGCLGIPKAFTGKLIGDLEYWTAGSATPGKANAIVFDPVYLEACN